MDSPSGQKHERLLICLSVQRSPRCPWTRYIRFRNFRAASKSCRHRGPDWRRRVGGGYSGGSKAVAAAGSRHLGSNPRLGPPFLIAERRGGCYHFPSSIDRRRELREKPPLKDSHSLYFER